MQNRSSERLVYVPYGHVEHARCTHPLQSSAWMLVPGGHEPHERHDTSFHPSLEVPAGHTTQLRSFELVAGTETYVPFGHDCHGRQ